MKFPLFSKDWRSRCKQKINSCSIYASLICPPYAFNIINYNFLKTASHNRCFPSLLNFTSLLRITFALLQQSCQENFVKFHKFYSSRFGGSDKVCYFSEILKWQHKLVQDFERGKLVPNAAKTCFVWAKNFREH